MPFLRVTCPSCSTVLKVPPEAAGKRVRCSACKNVMAVPAEESCEKPAVNYVADFRDEPPPVRCQTPKYEYAEFDDEYEESAGPSRTSSGSSGGDSVSTHSLGIASMVVGGVSLLASMVPIIGSNSLPVSCIGLLLGIAGFVVSTRRRWQGIGYPIAGTAMSLVAVGMGFHWWLAMQRVNDGFRRISEPQVSQRQPVQNHLPVNNPAPPERGNFGDVVRDYNSRNKTKEKAAVLSWRDVGPVAFVGELQISVMGVKVCGVWGKSYDRIANFEAGVVQLKLSNKSATRIARFDGWVGDGAIVDEHDNIYKARSLPSGFQFDGVPMIVNHEFDMHRSYITHGKDTLINPGREIVTYLFFEKFANVSKEARIILPAKEVGGIDNLLLRSPILR